MLILGQGALTRADGAAVLHLARKLAEAAGLVKEGWNGFNVLHTAAARVGGLELGFVPGPGGRDTARHPGRRCQGRDRLRLSAGRRRDRQAQLGNAFVVYQGHHGDAGAHRADVVLPGAAYTEKDGTYVNTEGRAQLGRAPFSRWARQARIGRSCAPFPRRWAEPLPYDNLLSCAGSSSRPIPAFSVSTPIEPAAWGQLRPRGALVRGALPPPITNFYMTDPISRASETMAKCTETYVADRRGGPAPMAEFSPRLCLPTALIVA